MQSFRKLRTGLYAIVFSLGFPLKLGLGFGQGTSPPPPSRKKIKSFPIKSLTSNNTENLKKSPGGFPISFSSIFILFCIVPGPVPFLCYVWQYYPCAHGHPIRTCAWRFHAQSFKFFGLEKDPLWGFS